MTNQVNQYERHMAIQEAYQIHDSDEYFKARPQLECGDRRKVFYAGHIRGYQASTQASEIEINSLKERVEELEAANSCLVRINVSLAKESEELAASNNQLRRALEKTFSRPKLQNEIDNILSSTPAQSLVERDNTIIERIATALENAEGELKYLPEYVALVRALKSI